MNPIRVLVVDDSPTARALLIAMLRTDPAILVVGEAADGAQAIDLARALLPDVITMDVHMLNMDGLAAGIGLIAALFLQWLLSDFLGPAHVLLLTALAGALLGFLHWNRHRARLFMGDCGSLFVGAVLGGTSLLGLQIVREIQRRLGVELSPIALFEAPTVRSLARHLDP